MRHSSIGVGVGPQSALWKSGRPPDQTVGQSLARNALAVPVRDSLCEALFATASQPIPLEPDFHGLLMVSECVRDLEVMLAQRGKQDAYGQSIALTNLEVGFRLLAAVSVCGFILSASRFERIFLHGI